MGNLQGPQKHQPLLNPLQISKSQSTYALDFDNQLDLELSTYHSFAMADDNDCNDHERGNNDNFIQCGFAGANICLQCTFSRGNRSKTFWVVIVCLWALCLGEIIAITLILAFGESKVGFVLRLEGIAIQPSPDPWSTDSHSPI